MYELIRRLTAPDYEDDSMGAGGWPGAGVSLQGLIPTAQFPLDVNLQFSVASQSKVVGIHFQ